MPFHPIGPTPPLFPTQPAQPLASSSGDARTRELTQISQMEWKTCEVLSQMIQRGDGEQLAYFRRGGPWRETMNAVLDSPEARFLEQLHPGTRNALSDWLYRPNQPTPSTATGVALGRLAQMLSVREDDDVRGKTPEEREASTVLMKWAMSSDPDFAPFRRLLVSHLMAQHHDGGLTLRERLPNQSRCWDRLDQAGLLSCASELAAPGYHRSTRNSAPLNERLTIAMGKVLGDDAAAAACAAYAAPTAGEVPRAAEERLALVEEVLAFQRSMPSPRLEPREGWEGFRASLATLERDGSAGDRLPWAAAWQALTTIPRNEEAGPRSVARRQHSSDSVRSALLMRLDSRQSDRSVQSRLSSRAPSLLPIYEGSAPSSAASGWSDSSPVRSAGGWSSQAHTRAASSTASTPSSLAWLPSVGRGETSVAEDEVEALPFQMGRHLSEAEAGDVEKILENADDRPMTPAVAQWRRAALAVLEDRRQLDGSVRLASDDMATVQMAVLHMMRMSMDRVSGAPGGGSDFRLRGPAETEALRSLADWAGDAQGAEGARRERWTELILDRALHPDHPSTIPAKLLAPDQALPPWRDTRTLVGAERVRDTGTLAWRGEPVAGGEPLSRLLEGLGVRHLDLPLSAIREQGLPGALSLDCMSAVTLHLDGKKKEALTGDVLDSLADSLRSVYIVRPVDARGPVRMDASTLPRLWDVSEKDEGRLIHIRRDAMRETMAPLKELWPQERMPPALRSKALNPSSGGQDVLEFLAKLRTLRAHHNEFRQGDLAMSVRLDSIIEGMAADQDYTDRCRRLVKHPLGECSDARMMMLSAMASMWEVSAAESPQEVATSAFSQACLNRADAARVERNPEFYETLEDAMVLRWFVTDALREMLGTDKIRAAPKPLFGRLGEGDDWDTPERREAFRAEARALIRDEARADFPGVVVQLELEGPIGDAFRQRLGTGHAFEALSAREAAARSDYALAMERDDSDSEGVATQVGDALRQIESERREARMAVLQPHLQQLKSQVLGDGKAERPLRDPVGMRAK